mmetsp:Transcript_52662/g.133671  ORF Transcript_52662/g.133671 Transcript_52662/m.133671 type:complete len:235 (-) Transcript_52662:164-868(-)
MAATPPPAVVLPQAAGRLSGNLAVAEGSGPQDACTAAPPRTSHLPERPTHLIKDKVVERSSEGLPSVRRRGIRVRPPVPLLEHQHARHELIALHRGREHEVHPPVVHDDDGGQRVGRQRHGHMREVRQVVTEANVLHVGEGVLDDGPLDVHRERGELFVEGAKAVKKPAITTELHENLATCELSRERVDDALQLLLHLLLFTSAELVPILQHGQRLLPPVLRGIRHYWCRAARV